MNTQPSPTVRDPHLRAPANAITPIAQTDVTPVSADQETSNDDLAFERIEPMPRAELAALGSSHDQEAGGVTFHVRRDFFQALPNEPAGHITTFLTHEEQAQFAAASRGTRSQVEVQGLLGLHPNHQAYLAVRATGNAVATAQSMDNLVQAFVTRRTRQYWLHVFAAFQQKARTMAFAFDANTPEYFDIHMEAADRYRELGQHDRAIELIDHCIDLVGELAHLRTTLAGHLIVAGRIDEAVAQARSACHLAPHDLQARTHLARGLLLQNTPAALQLLSRFAADIPCRALQVMAYDALGEPGAAERELRSAESGSSLWDEAEPEAMAEMWASRIGMVTLDPWGHPRNAMDLAFEQLSFLQPERASLGAIAQSPFLVPLHGDPRWGAFLHRIARRDDDLAQVRFDFSPRLDLYLDMPELTEFLEAREDLDREKLYCNHWINRDGVVPPAVESRFQQAELALEIETRKYGQDASNNYYRQARSEDVAIRIEDAEIDGGPEDAPRYARDFLLPFAMQLADLGRFDVARHLMDHAWKLLPESVSIASFRIEMLAAAGCIAEAETAVRQLGANRPDLDTTYVQLARVLLLKGNSDEELRALVDGNKLSPSMAALVMARTGRQTEARQLLSQFSLDRTDLSDDDRANIVAAHVALAGMTEALQWVRANARSESFHHTQSYHLYSDLIAPLRGSRRLNALLAMVHRAPEERRALDQALFGLLERAAATDPQLAEAVAAAHAPNDQSSNASAA